MAPSSAQVFLASDHRGFRLKSVLKNWLSEQRHSVTDLGTHSDERCDAFDFAQKLAHSLREGASVGVLICGTGHAMAMTANRYRHIRAAHAGDWTSARLAREHNDANVLVLGAELTGPGVALDCLKIFLTTSFLDGRYAERLRRLDALGGL